MLGRLMKEWKKRIKRKKRPIWSLGLIAMLFLTACAVGISTAGVYARSFVALTEVADVWSPSRDVDKPGPFAEANDPKSMSKRGKALGALATMAGNVEVVLHRSYVCGEETRMLGSHTALEARELLASHLDWEADVDQAAGQVVMEEQVDDLSPACKQNAYIAMDEDGNLSLFEGKPRKDNVLRTFFQLDVRSLESNLPIDKIHELAGGIKVSDKSEYDSVLSTYSDYAVVQAEGVMKPAR